MRVPHAARTLAQQLGERYKTVKMEATGDPDGLNVHREVEFAKGPAATLLAKVLPHLDDHRIVDHRVKGGAVTVVFSDRTIADSRDPFPLSDAETVASAAAADEGDDGDDAGS
jgi:hypothetical protein